MGRRGPFVGKVISICERVRKLRKPNGPGPMLADSLVDLSGNFF
jgi:hypothetical protein